MALWGLLSFPLGRFIKRRRPDWEKAPYAEWGWEDSGRAYEKVGIRRWKDFVPDVSKMFSAIVPRKAFSGRPDAAKLKDMLLETCVAELVHYILCVAGLPLLRLWPGFGGAARISERIAEAEAASGARIRRKPPPPAPRSL